MGGEDDGLRVKARENRRRAEDRTVALPDGPEHDDRDRGTEEYALQAMVSSAQAHERAALLLERMATAHPEEAELHLQSATRHRRWAENDRRLAEEYAPPDGA